MPNKSFSGAAPLERQYRMAKSVLKPKETDSSSVSSGLGYNGELCPVYAWSSHLKLYSKF